MNILIISKTKSDKSKNVQKLMFVIFLKFCVRIVFYLFLNNLRLDAVEDLMTHASVVSEVKNLMRSIPDLDRILRRYIVFLTNCVN